MGSDCKTKDSDNVFGSLTSTKETCLCYGFDLADYTGFVMKRRILTTLTRQSVLFYILTELIVFNIY